jgi:putative ABC transport system permease protein
MVPIARRNLLAEKFRLAIAIGGVAFAVFLIVTIQTLYTGWRHGAGEFARQFPVDLWIVQEGIADIARSSSHVPDGLAEEVAAVAGVGAAINAQGRLLTVHVEDRRDVGFFLAVEDSFAAEAAFRELGYERAPAPGEVILHDSMGSPGDTVRLGETEFTAIDTYAGGIPIGGYSFMSYSDASALFGLPGYANYVIVFLEDPDAAQQVQAFINNGGGGLEVLTPDELVEVTGQEVESFLPVITALLVIAFLVGAAVISLIIYTATIERARDYAVLKALGASNTDLYRIVLTQSFIVGVTGFVLGVPSAVIAGSLIQRIVPEFLTRLDWTAIVAVLVAVVIMSLTAAFLPANRLARIEPATVFRA